MIGLEPTFDEHLENLVAVFREVRRVMRPDATLWLNYGDAFAGGGRGLGSGKQLTNKGAAFQPPFHPAGFKPKDLMLMPARVAMALQDDGWWLRSEIVWHKPNPMPESVTDRPTSAHEKLFLLSKAPRYSYDAEAVRLPPSGRTDPITSLGKHAEQHDRGDAANTYQLDGRVGANLRNVWTIPTHGYSEAHFATFPPALVEPCIKAGTSEKGACAECGAPWVRAGERTKAQSRETARLNGDRNDAGTTQFVGARFDTTGWSPSCECDAGVRPCVVLDPFGGSGTVGLVADRLQRDAVLIEISPDYADMARKRIHDDAPLLMAAAE